MGQSYQVFLYSDKNSESRSQEFQVAGLEIFETYELLESMEMRNWKLFVSICSENIKWVEYDEMKIIKGPSISIVPWKSYTGHSKVPWKS